jgi:hypothetical protein
MITLERFYRGKSRTNIVKLKGARVEQGVVECGSSYCVKEADELNKGRRNFI